MTSARPSCADSRGCPSHTPLARRPPLCRTVCVARCVSSGPQADDAGPTVRLWCRLFVSFMKPGPWRVGLACEPRRPSDIRFSALFRRSIDCHSLTVAACGTSGGCPCSRLQEKVGLKHRDSQNHELGKFACAAPPLAPGFLVFLWLRRVSRTARVVLAILPCITLLFTLFTLAAFPFSSALSFSYCMGRRAMSRGLVGALAAAPLALP